jgi:hypothetical protein
MSRFRTVDVGFLRCSGKLTSGLAAATSTEKKSPSDHHIPEPNSTSIPRSRTLNGREHACICGTCAVAHAAHAPTRRLTPEGCRAHLNFSRPGLYGTTTVPVLAEPVGPFSLALGPAQPGPYLRSPSRPTSMGPSDSPSEPLGSLGRFMIAQAARVSAPRRGPSSHIEPRPGPAPGLRHRPFPGPFLHRSPRRPGAPSPPR